jgi:hypothetical protein
MISDSSSSPTETALSAGATGEDHCARVGLSTSSVARREVRLRCPQFMCRRWRWRPIDHRLWPAGSFFGDFRTPRGARNSSRKAPICF